MGVAQGIQTREILSNQNPTPPPPSAKLESAPSNKYLVLSQGIVLLGTSWIQRKARGQACSTYEWPSRNAHGDTRGAADVHDAGPPAGTTREMTATRRPRRAADAHDAGSEASENERKT